MMKLTYTQLSYVLVISSLMFFSISNFIDLKKTNTKLSATVTPILKNENNVVSSDTLPPEFIPCSQTSAWKAATERDPDLLKKHNKWEEEMLNTQLKNKASSNNESSILPYELPVVVHVIHNGGSENISDAEVQMGIANLNDAFANQGYYNQGIGYNTQISFCLATRDPNGSFTTGINHVQSNLTIMNQSSDDLALKNLIRWDPNNYINIWVVKEICSIVSCGTLGYAYFPSSHGTNQDGIVIEAPYVGATEANSSVLAHELGHYLGLYHTFQGGCSNNDCLYEGDRVCDTPPDQSTVFSPCNVVFNSCSTDVNPSDPNNPFTSDQNDYTFNFMDYGFPECLHAFTPGQASRMHNAIDITRNSLLNSIGCLSPCPMSVTSSFDVPNAPIYVGTTVTFNNTSTGGLYFNWTIDQVPFNGTFTFDTAGTFEISLVVTNDDPNCIISSTATVTVICGAQAALISNINNTQINSIINFTDNSTNADNITWTVDGVPASSNPNFQFSSPTIGTFTICLIANNNICQSEVCKQILITDNKWIVMILIVVVI